MPQDYAPDSCPRSDTRFSLGRDVGEPGQGFEGKLDEVTVSTLINAD